MAELANLEAMRSEIDRWFAAVKSVQTVDLPRGPFGRPGDHNLGLTWSLARNRRLLLELSTLLEPAPQTYLIIVTEPKRVEVSEDELAIKSCDQVTIDFPYSHTEAYLMHQTHGDVRFESIVRKIERWDKDRA